MDGGIGKETAVEIEPRVERKPTNVTMPWEEHLHQGGLTRTFVPKGEKDDSDRITERHVNGKRQREEDAHYVAC